jgi:hypothetical protein
LFTDTVLTSSKKFTRDINAITVPDRHVPETLIYCIVIVKKLGKFGIQPRGVLFSFSYDFVRNVSALTPWRGKKEGYNPARASTGSGPGCGVLLVEKLELLVQRWVALPELDGILEKEFRGNGEELCWIGGSVLVEKRLPVMLEIFQKGLVLPAEHPCPCRVSRPGREERGSVSASGFQVELVGKLVKHHVVSVVNEIGASLYIIPGEYE